MTQRRLHPVSRILVLLLSLSVVVPPSYGQFSGGGSSSGRVGSGASAGVVQGNESGATALPVIRQSASSDDRALQAGLSGGPGALSAPPKALPPNDFQRFVLETSGQALPLFGSGFFSQSASPLYVPQGNTPVSPDYRVGPGDELQVRGWGSVDIDVRAVVDRDGQIHIPRIGKINLSGIRSGQAEDVIRAAVGKYYRDFQLSVTLGQLRGITVYVVGQARKPGSYALSSNSTLISALFASGGPSQTGSMRRVQVKRAEKLVTELDLYTFLAKGDKSADIKLQDGDTIVIPAARGYVALSGKVSNSAVYELANDGETLGAMLAVAGGLPVVADPKRAQLERLDPNKKPARSVEVFALDGSGLARKLKSGDILTVSELVPEFGNAVTLRGTVAQPVRNPWRPGMKIRDLIPDRAYLMSRASVKRQNDVLLSDQDKRNAVASDAFNLYDGRPTDQPGQNAKQVGDSVDTLAGRIGNLVDEINLDYAVIERVDVANVSVKLLPFSLGKALDDANSPDNLPLQAGDVVTVFSVNDVRVPQAKRQVYVRVEGEVQRPGIYQMRPGDGLPHLIDQAGGLTADAYLFGAAFYREEVKRAQAANLDQLVRRLESQVETRLSSSAASVSGTDAGVAQLRIQAEAQAQRQALDRLRNLKPSGRIMLGLVSDGVQANKLPALRLENQDRLVVPARPDFVYVLGSVNTESSLIWRDGATVQDYLNQSGLTSGADVDQLFVLRADGSVLSDTGGWFSSPSRARVLPGDVIVLPEKTDHESAWSVFTRNAKDITQIIYQFSLGAAAIKTLRE
ncbi:MAG: SLBB domain-containing protein [Aquabacterium sp.]|uniref:polysaccharide biosynthesis/export family protein n=1 Tax=Aquabacterium sp. TaxID=1872578 RepID=UPI0025B8CDA2|nr:SLBB domain-containing protein [Aquabacterium sp.]MBI5925030.1 SLBB domain-containing protein [Aquabacterium sp.]